MGLDPNILKTFEPIRDRDEEIYWVGAPALVPFLTSGIPFLIIGLLWGVIDFGFIRLVSKDIAGFMIPFFVIHLFPFWGSILNMVRLMLVHGNTKYAYTNRRLLIRSGFWGIDFKAVDYDRLADLEVNVNPLENMYGVGTIRFFSGKVTTRGYRLYDNFTAIAQPYEVFTHIKEIAVDIKTDWNYPNALRPGDNPGYHAKYINDSDQTIR
jgi:hypothetical protein